MNGKYPRGNFPAHESDKSMKTSSLLWLIFLSTSYLLLSTKNQSDMSAESWRRWSVLYGERREGWKPLWTGDNLTAKSPMPPNEATDLFFVAAWNDPGGDTHWVLTRSWGSPLTLLYICLASCVHWWTVDFEQLKLSFIRRHNIDIGFDGGIELVSWVRGWN